MCINVHKIIYLKEINKNLIFRLFSNALSSLVKISKSPLKICIKMPFLKEDFLVHAYFFPLLSRLGAAVLFKRILLLLSNMYLRVLPVLYV